MGLREDPIPRNGEICWAFGKHMLTRGQAKSLANRVSKRQKEKQIKEYLCSSCGKWHVGTPGRWRR